MPPGTRPESLAENTFELLNSESLLTEEVNVTCC